MAFPAASAAGAGEWAVKLKAVNAGTSYTTTLVSPAGRQAAFDGKPKMRGQGPARELIFRSFLNAPENGLYRLDYQVEFYGSNGARPPFQAAGKLLLRPGKPVLAAQAAAWKLYLELEGKAAGKTPNHANSRLTTSLKCGRKTYPANFAYLPGEQYSAVTFTEEDDTVTNFMAGLLPNTSAMDGAFILQYTLLLREGSKTLTEKQGELILVPGGPNKSATAGPCRFTAKALP